MKLVRLSETLLEILDSSCTIWGEQRELTKKEKIVRSALKYLTINQRNVNMATIYWGWSEQKIADTLKISLSAIRDRKTLAMNHLKELIGPVLFPDEYDNWSPLMKITKQEFERRKRKGGAA